MKVIKLSGYKEWGVWWSDNTPEGIERGIITGALLRDNKELVIDWDEKSGKGHLEARTSDGINFQGWYNYREGGEEGQVTLKAVDRVGGDHCFLGGRFVSNDRREKSRLFELSFEEVIDTK